MAEENTLESQVNEFIEAYLKEAKRIRKTYKLNKTEAMLVLNRFELAKIHSHIDNFLLAEKRKKKTE